MGTADRFSYYAPPTVTGLSPTAGPLVGGTQVTITGTNFYAGATVSFGTNAASNVQVTSSTSIVCNVPPTSSSSIADVIVTSLGGRSSVVPSDQYSYDPVPTVASVSPSSGPLGGGTQVTVSGTGFVAGASVSFGGLSATATVVSPTSISASSPPEAAGSVDVKVTTPGGSSAVSPSDQYTYLAAPSVTNVSPATGPAGGGTTVTITGQNFAAGSLVKFGSQSASNIVVASSTSITASSPPGVAGIVDVTVTTPGGVSPSTTADQFTYT